MRLEHRIESGKGLDHPPLIEGGGTSKLGWEVLHVRHDAAALEFGAETHARVSRTDENQRRSQSAGAP